MFRAASFRWAIVIGLLVLIQTGSRIPETSGQQDSPPAAQVDALSTPANSPAAPGESPAFEILSSGPLHESFAETVQERPAPGVIVDRQPPPPIDEIPPEVQPEGSNVVWIPGYWAWSDELDDFLWVTGVYRSVPPGMRWVPGYWAPAGGRWQWVSGFWVSQSAGEVSYLPAPPESLERGPSSPAVGSDYFWVPGCWEWRTSGYAWRAGYWTRHYANWIWIPARYCWTPRGYVFVGGYWDYPFDRRGLCYAPVYYRTPIYLQSGYVYRPRIAFNLGNALWYLFVRPAHGHYYVGNYFGQRYGVWGFQPWFVFHEARGCYDPLYVYYRWYNGRGNRNWEGSLRRHYQDLTQREVRTARGTFSGRMRPGEPFDRDRPLTLPADELRSRSGSFLVVADQARMGSFREQAESFRALSRRRADEEVGALGRESRAATRVSPYASATAEATSPGRMGTLQGHWALPPSAPAAVRSGSGNTQRFSRTDRSNSRGMQSDAIMRSLRRGTDQAAPGRRLAVPEVRRNNHGEGTPPTGARPEAQRWIPPGLGSTSGRPFWPGESMRGNSPDPIGQFLGTQSPTGNAGREGDAAVRGRNVPSLLQRGGLSIPEGLNSNRGVWRPRGGSGVPSAITGALPTFERDAASRRNTTRDFWSSVVSPPTLERLPTRNQQPSKHPRQNERSIQQGAAQRARTLPGYPPGGIERMRIDRPNWDQISRSFRGRAGGDSPKPSGDTDRGRGRQRT